MLKTFQKNLAPTGIEPAIFSLQEKCSTTEPRGLWLRWELNPRLFAYEANALPIELHSLLLHSTTMSKEVFCTCRESNPGLMLAVLLRLEGIHSTTKIQVLRHLEDLNLCSQGEVDFKSTALTAPPRCRLCFHNLYSEDFFRLLNAAHEPHQKLTDTSPGRRILKIESKVLSLSFKGLLRFKRNAPPCSLHALKRSIVNPPVKDVCVILS